MSEKRMEVIEMKISANLHFLVVSVDGLWWVCHQVGRSLREKLNRRKDTHVSSMTFGRFLSSHKRIAGNSRSNHE